MKDPIMNRQALEAGAAPVAADQYITCTLDAAEYGLDIMAVREIKGWSETTAIPHAPPWIRGVINLRGVIVPILDLRVRFGMGATEPTPVHVVVIVQCGARTAGVVVDAVSDIIAVAPSDVRPLPDVGGTAPARLLSGLVPREQGMVSILALDALLDFQAEVAFSADAGQADAILAA